MPGLVQDYIRPLLPQLDKRTLSVMQRDIEEAALRPNCHADAKIDLPGCISFMEEVKQEQKDGE